MIKNSFFNPIDQWLGMNREVKTLKIAVLFLATLTLILAIFTIFALNLAPIVIKETDNERIHYVGERDVSAPNVDDVKEFLRKFIVYRFEFHSNKLESTLKNITPFSTQGYLAALTGDFKKDFSDKEKIGSIEQYVANIKVIVSEKEVLATFDKIVRINGVPLVVPTEASFQVVKDSPSRFNPFGILINGVVEHERK